MQDTDNLKEDFNIAKARLEELRAESGKYSEEQRSALNYLDGIFTEISSNLLPVATDAEWEGFRSQLTKFFTKLENEAKILAETENFDLDEVSGS